MVAANAEIDKATTNDGATPLLIAAVGGHTDVVELLVAANAEIDKATTDNGSTPLHAAAQNGHIDVLRMDAQNQLKSDVLALLVPVHSVLL